MGQLICGIYAKRPEMCRKYPERDSYIPEGCSFWFDAEGVRRGECDPDCGAACCKLPRRGGEPGEAAMPEIAGGESCKHIRYADRHPAVSGDRPGDTQSGDDRGSNRSESDSLKLALAKIDRSKGDSDSSPQMGDGGGAREGS